MALESASYIDGLVITNPTGSDSISRGDDHLRLIKTVLKNSLPNVTTATTPIVAVTHNLPASSGAMRNESDYETTAQTITHTKVSSTSTLYITYNGQLNGVCNFDSGSYQAWVRLSNSSGTLIGGTTDDILWAFTDDVDHSSNPSWDFMHGVTHTWKVTSANCPDGTTGANTFTLYGKIREYDDGSATYSQGSMICLEVEQ